MSRNPLYAFIAFLLIEAAIAAGFLSKEDAPNVQAQLEEVIFYLVLAGSGAYGLKQYFHTHTIHMKFHLPHKEGSPVAGETVKKVDEPFPVFTEASPTDETGTPPVGTEQQIGSIPFPGAKTE